MKFSTLAEYLERLDKTASRNEITRILAELFKKAGEEEIDKVCYLILGELLPAYRGVDFNMAEKLMATALSVAYKKTPAEILRLYKSRGDMGDIAYELSQKAKTGRKSALDTIFVYDTLLEIARYSGTGSQDRKIKKMAGLLSFLDARSAKYASRIPIGKLRLGFSDPTILDALSLMERGDKSLRPLIERAYNVKADIGIIAKKVKKSGVKSLSNLEAEPGLPIRPSLAERLNTAEEVLEKVGPRVGIEQKLDGFRTQIHVLRGAGRKEVMLFSRNLENTTPMFPEIAASAKMLAVEDIILDGETIGYNAEMDHFAPFQETVQRKRKHGVEEFAKKIPLSTFVFDILYLNGKSFLNFPFAKRRAILEKLMSHRGDKSALRLTSQKITEDPQEIDQDLKKSVGKGLEGLVVKNLKAPYQAGNRGFHWVKLKATTAALEKLRAGEKRGAAQLLDTIDCVIMGAYKGRGKRAQFGVGGFLLGVRSGDKFLTISRLGTGLSDGQLREAKKRIEKLRASEPPKEYTVEKEAVPDIWAKPSLVAEILADEITLSPRHTAGRGKNNRGYSLRFPRLVRFRDDKNPEDATTVEEIEKMYKKQKMGKV